MVLRPQWLRKTRLKRPFGASDSQSQLQISSSVTPGLIRRIVSFHDFGPQPCSVANPVDLEGVLNNAELIHQGFDGHPSEHSFPLIS